MAINPDTKYDHLPFAEDTNQGNINKAVSAANRLLGGKKTHVRARILRSLYLAGLAHGLRVKLKELLK